MKFKTDFPPETRQTEENTYKSFIDKEINDNFRVLNNQFLIERLGGIERSINNSLIPSMFGSPEHASKSISYLVEYFKKNNIPTEQQLQFIKAIQLSLNDIQLLAEDKNATYEYVQFAYQWAGFARDKWNLSQESIKSILNETTKSLEKEKAREDIPYLTSLYLDPENMLSRKSKIDRFMQNMTPNLIDEVNHIYHFDPTGENPIFLKLDTEEKKKEVEDFLAEVREGWDKMFKETPTVKTYTHYELPEEFQKFVLSDNQVRDYFPHIAFTEDENVLRGDMKNMLNPQIRESLQRDIGVDLTQLQQEQAYFIEYISNKKRGEILPLKNFVNTYGKEGLKTFISCAQNKKMGDKILTLGEKLSEGTAREVFSKYGEIIDTADSTEKILKNILPEKVVNESQDEIREIRESLLIRAKDLLITFHDKKDKDNGVLLKDLERYKSEILLIGDTYKKLKQSGKEVRLEDIKNIKITILSQEEKEKIGGKLWDITKANRPFIKEGTEEMNNREKSFISTIKNKDSSFYVLKYGNKDDVVAFCSFTPDENGDLYAESLNIESEIKSSKIGGEFFPSVLEKVKSLGKDIYGHVHPKNSGILNYYERLGFKIKEIKEGEDVKYYEIRIPAQEIFKLAA